MFIGQANKALDQAKNKIFIFVGYLSHWLNLQHWTCFYFFHCSLWQFSGALFFFFFEGSFLRYGGKIAQSPRVIFFLLSEMPTSTFLPYFVRFLKENTAVRFSRQNTFLKILLFFFILESESSTLHTLFMLWKLGQSFWMIMLKKG